MADLNRATELSKHNDMGNEKQSSDNQQGHAPLAGVVRSCLDCRFASETYKLTKEGYYPPTGIYLQCNVSISDELRDMLPSSFYRATSMKVGAVDPDTGDDVLIRSVGEDCPCFEA